MYAYETSHPWLTFSINLTRTPARVWALLGECSALARALAEMPLPASERNVFDRQYLARWVQSALPSGMDALGCDEIEQIIEGTDSLAPSRQYLAVEARNLVKGAGMISEGLRGSMRSRIYSQLISDFNATVLDGLVLPGQIVPGQYRQEDLPLFNGTAQAAPSGDCGMLVDSLCDWLGSQTFSAPENMEIMYGLITAVIAHLYMRWISPFGDGNIRTIRLIEYHILCAAGVSPSSALLLGIHYASTSSEYERMIQASGGPDGLILPFLRYSIEGFRDRLREQRERTGSILTKALWRYRVTELFMDRTSPADIRRRRLALELCGLEEPIPLPKLLDAYPKAAVLYATKTYKTLTRDINDLVSMRLLAKTDDGVKVNGQGC